MEPRSPALQTNSLPSKPPGKPALHQLSLCCSLCSECLHSGFFHSPLPPSIPGFWLFFHPFFFLSSHINVLFITDYKLCTTSVEQFLSFSCKLVHFIWGMESWRPHLIGNTHFVKLILSNDTALSVHQLKWQCHVAVTMSTQLMLPANSRILWFWKKNFQFTALA